METDSSQSQHNTACACNPKVPQHKSPAIACIDCSASVQVACLLNQYRLSLPKQETLKNTQEWLHGFIVFTGLHHRCAACQQQPRGRTGISQDGSFGANDAQEVSKLCKDFATLQNVVSVISGSLTQLTQEVSVIASKL